MPDATAQPALTCLQCGQAKAEIKRDQTICGIVSVGEYQELTDEWPQHRWTDWKDHELPMILPAFRDQYRRASVFDLQWVGCEHTPQGHTLVTEAPGSDDYSWGMKVGQCIACGATPPPLPEQELADDFERNPHK